MTIYQQQNSAPNRNDPICALKAVGVSQPSPVFQTTDHVVGLSGIVLPKQVQHQKRVCNRGDEEGGVQNTFA